MISNLITTDLLKQGRQNKKQFVGRPYYLSYDIARLLVCDAWKAQVKGIPAGCFLLAFYDGEDGVEEAVLLRALYQTKLPTDNDVITSMIEYYKDNQDISGRAGTKKNEKLDDFTRYEFSFSGLECSILGVFYRTNEGNIEFGADLENFYSANNYSVYKASGEVLEAIVNSHNNNSIENYNFKIGYVRYSSSRIYQPQEEEVSVKVKPEDFLGKRTALFGMTRTGKSNTVKKLIEATEEQSIKKKLSKETAIRDFDDKGIPILPVGQIIFDVNGEYANPNRQDSGTAIYDLYKEKVIRYSVVKKTDFKVLKVNFYKDIEAGFSLICNFLYQNSIGGDYINNFAAVNINPPEEFDESQKRRFDRLIAVYKCCLFKAGFELPKNETVKFTGFEELNSQTKLKPEKGISLQEACNWFEKVWNEYNEIEYIINYPAKKGREWANDDLKALLIFLTTYKLPGKKSKVSGYTKIRVNQLHQLHTTSLDKSFELEITENLQSGHIVIVDLSQGEPIVQKLFSERICRSIFNAAMENFIENKPNNFIQFYFEEAHNLFPKKDDKDLSQIYNRIAKEGAKLNLGMIYATQEVSSISSNILKNTQNWFIAHLNNIDETKELEKYYDFKDFTHSLTRFSATNDKGFVRMKTYTNPFVVPVQIDRFLANKDSK